MFIKVAVPQQFKLRVIPDIKSLIFGSGKEIHYIGGTEGAARRRWKERMRKK